jgi:Tol biopolymer transport system component
MRRPRGQFTVAMLMLVIAIAGLVIGGAVWGYRTWQSSGRARVRRQPAGAVRFARALAPPPAEFAAQLVDQFKRHPVEPAPARGRIALYVMDVTSGELTLIADQPAPGLTHCGSATWSHDGRRILFDATPGTQYGRSRLWSIEVGDEQPMVRELGAGNCPTFSPADDRIFFLSNVGQSGVSLMKADGSDRQLLGDYGKPIASPDGRQLIIMSFEAHRQLTLMDVNPAKSAEVELAGEYIHAHPSWTGKGTIVTVIGSTQGDTIALLDVSDPPQAKVTLVLWHRASGPDVEPSYPIYSATTGRCVFVGKKAGKDDMTIYSIQRNAAGPAKPLRPEMHPGWVADLAYSPDGRYIVFSAGAIPK